MSDNVKIICKHENKNVYKIYNNKEIYKCSDCGLIFLKSEEIFSVNKYENYYKESGGRFSFVVEIFVKMFRFTRAVKIKLLMPKGKSILDVGCGRGYMLFFLKKYFGFESAVGTQISPNALKFCRDKLKLKVYGDDLMNIDLKDKKFDVISIWHVLEHLKNPEEYIAKFFQILNKGGNLVIEVPNFNAWSRYLTGRYWLSLDFDNHIYFFTEESIKNLLTKYNFKIVKVNTFSLEYSVFTSAQSISSWVTKTDHKIFNWLQCKKFDLFLPFYVILFSILFLVSLLINILLYFTKNGEVINIVAKK